MRTRIGFIFLSVSTFSCFLSKKAHFFINESNVIRVYNIELNIPQDDTLYYLKGWGKDRGYKIYYSKNKMAARGYIHSDSIVQLNYWRNGYLKELKVTFNKSSIVKIYCKNGQLISTMVNRMEGDTTFYCNGQIKKILRRADHSATHFYENGKTASRESYNASSQKNGLFIWFLEDSSRKYQYYIEDRLIYSGDSLPDLYKEK